MVRVGLAFLSALLVSNSLLANPSNDREISHFDVVWDSPSADASGSMPIGNGEVVLNAWVEKSTGDLVFYIGRSDSLSEVSRILKLGKVRIHLSSNPFLAATDFKQHLRLRDGMIEITGAGSSLELFVDSESNMVGLSGHLQTAATVTITNEPWRTEPHTLSGEEANSAWSAMGAPFPLTESADHLWKIDPHGIGWFHRNETSVVPALLELQALTGLPGAHDPLLHRTFGAAIASNELEAVSETSLSSPRPISHFSATLTTLCEQTDSVQSWQTKLVDESKAAAVSRAKSRTVDFWHKFWNRSWFDCSDTLIAQGYNLQRYVQACQSRGTYPFKFNGGTYTVEPKAMGKPFNPDWRAWGDAQWFQNVRHMQHPMLASGDFDMMEPFFHLYEGNRELAESRTHLYHQAKGTYYPETMTMFGTYGGNDYGWARAGLSPADVQSPWWRYAWNQGPELVALMLDRWDYTRDESFLKNRVLPMAHSVLDYFDTRFKKDSNGKIVLDPTQSVETYWADVVNDMPSTAGLIAITSRLSALPPRLLTKDQAAFFSRMAAASPALPFQDKAGAKELAPAEKYKPDTSNVENPELYAVWPFRVVSLQSPQYLQEGITAYQNRLFHQDVGWGYDGNAAALLGLTDESARILKKKSENSNKAYRWPASWGPNFDWIPDQNHGGNYLETTDLMLLQGQSIEAGGKILLLPAWPKAWDVRFKLHAPGNTTVECVAKSGKIVELLVSPASRAKDIVLADGWTR